MIPTSNAKPDFSLTVDAYKNNLDTMLHLRISHDATTLQHLFQVAGFNVTSGEEDARASALEVLMVAISNPAAWPAVAGVIISYLRRHRGKRIDIRIGQTMIRLNDYSARDSEHVINDAIKAAMDDTKNPHESKPKRWPGSLPDKE